MKSILWILAAFALTLQWFAAYFFRVPLAPPWAAILPGLGIFGAAFILSWGAELAELEIPQSLALAFLALVAVLPEYAVDIYFAWTAGKDPSYIHYATANMTGSNRLLIGIGWPVVLFFFGWVSHKRQLELDKDQSVELSLLLVASLYAFVIPFKHTLSLLDTVFFLGLFAFYMILASRAHHETPELEGPAELFGRWPRGIRIFMTFFFFILSGLTIFIAAKPFAEGLLATGRAFKIEEFILVQWLAPLASESPEFIVAILFALKGRAQAGIGTLVSSKVNQWTLLVGMLPLAYAISSGSPHAMVLDGRQTEEILLTASQSLFAMTILANFRFSLGEALALLILFSTQLFFTQTSVRLAYSGLYVLLSVGMIAFIPAYRHGVRDLLSRTFRLRLRR